jgi:hypothetical protein
MRVTKGVLFIVVLVASASLAYGQEKDEPLRPDIQEMISKLPEEVRQQYERLLRADFAKLELAPWPLKVGEPIENLPRHFKEGDPVTFRLLITNISWQKVSFSCADSLRDQRPRLVRDGDEVPFSKHTAEILRGKEEDPVGRSSRAATLEPNETLTELVDLRDWYEPLKPGHYQLTVRRRFYLGGKWIESPAITFDVDPKSPSK